MFDPYANCVLNRWQAGVHDGKQPYEETRQPGFPGSIRLVYTFLQTFREKRHRLTDLASPTEHFSAHRAVWFFIRDPAAFTVEEQEELTPFETRVRQLGRHMDRFKSFFGWCANAKEIDWTPGLKWSEPDISNPDEYYIFG